MLVDVDFETAYRKRLAEELIARQRKNPQYSLRSFARSLHISPAALSQALNGKRNLSRSNILKVAERLSFTPSETNHALSEIRGVTPNDPDKEFDLVQDDAFKFMSDWYYFAIHALAQTHRAKADSTWLAERFGITELEAKEAMARLHRLGLIETKRGMLHSTGRPLQTTTEIPSAPVRSLQRGHLRLAEASLERDPIHLRDMTSMTTAIRMDRLPEAKEMIKKFRRRLSKFLGSDSGEEVYVLGIQLFPVTREVRK